MSAYFNYANLNFMMLYRDYDLEFDNPYARPFAEHERFDGTILEKQYYLKNPLVSEMYYNSPMVTARERFIHRNPIQISSPAYTHKSIS